MPISADDVRALILTAFPDAAVDVRDTTGGGDHYAARVVSARFEKRLPVERHRMVYAALGAAMRADIHALALVTITPDEATRETKPEPTRGLP